MQSFLEIIFYYWRCYGRNDLYREMKSCTRILFSLGSTRFFKVARARHMPSDGSEVVVKVFTIQDHGVDLGNDQEKILSIGRLLDGCPNCLPFQVWLQSQIFVARSPSTKWSDAWQCPYSFSVVLETRLGFLGSETEEITGMDEREMWPLDHWFAFQANQWFLGR